MNLANYVKYPHVKKYKTLLNENKAEVNKWRNTALFMGKKTQYCQNVSCSQINYISMYFQSKSQQVIYG